MISEFIRSRTGVIILSIVWGLGLSTLFRKACQGRHCHVIVYNGPDPNEVKNTTYDYGTGQCYKYEPIISDCDDTS